ncbi:MAG TPA: metallophosphoesterase [Anaeromyxobacter sp.]
MTLLVASDWHLSPRSPAAHARLARDFLALARAERARVVLNGDVFDDLFSGPGRAEAAHPEVVRDIEALAAEGRLVRTRGNHDPGAGEERAVLDVPGTGRVLVLHGHQVDPLSRSPAGRLGDAVSRRFGRTLAVRWAARLAEEGARAVAGGPMASLFRRRALALVVREGFDLGVFGHVHVAHAAPGDRYANAGALLGEALQFLELGPAGPVPRILRLRAGAEGRQRGALPAEVGRGERAP